jgi:hypothetical protein
VPLAFKVMTRQRRLRRPHPRLLRSQRRRQLLRECPSPVRCSCLARGWSRQAQV